ncbi:unnamed protein product [Cuscuta campestris]|uniref:EF-hand domain-containing protein n=1 Tax=Cuscuta campestris TaxID=132261 RepID=A0A484N1W8_9ASTE|nr:unnamed protein product [Cuscuta campestris]
MASNGFGGGESFSPSAPPLPATDEPCLAQPYHPASPPSVLHPPTTTHSVPSYAPATYSVPSYAPATYSVPSYAPPATPSQQQSSSNYGPSPSHGYDSYSAFPPGTHPDVIRSFQMVDLDHSGLIEDKELLQALSTGYQKFSLRTIRLLISLFKNPSESSLRIGALSGAIQRNMAVLTVWHSEMLCFILKWLFEETFERFDRDGSGKIDETELRDALYSLGYLVPPLVLQLLVSRYDDCAGLDFNEFVECGMIFKGLTEKFKEKDTQYAGSAKLSYDEFLSMVIPFLVSY